MSNEVGFPEPKIHNRNGLTETAVDSFGVTSGSDGIRYRAWLQVIVFYPYGILTSG